MDTLKEVEFSSLSKKERKALKKEMEREEREKKGKQTSFVKWLVIVGLLGVLGGIGWLGYKELSKPLPGQEMADQGREHVKKEEWEKFTYNSNPPTSGPHEATWIKTGIYDKEQGDGNLVHSLEHGYVILSYNCGEGAEQECNSLKKQLSDLANDKRLFKLIVVPRSKLDSRIALTAWTRIDKMDLFDRERIVRFIDAYRNNGPEKTTE